MGPGPARTAASLPLATPREWTRTSPVPAAKGSKIASSSEPMSFPPRPRWPKRTSVRSVVPWSRFRATSFERASSSRAERSSRAFGALPLRLGRGERLLEEGPLSAGKRAPGTDDEGVGMGVSQAARAGLAPCHPGPALFRGAGARSSAGVGRSRFHRSEADGLRAPTLKSPGPAATTPRNQPSEVGSRPSARAEIRKARERCSGVRRRSRTRRGSGDGPAKAKSRATRARASSSLS